MFFVEIIENIVCFSFGFRPLDIDCIFTRESSIIQRIYFGFPSTGKTLLLFRLRLNLHLSGKVLW